MSYWKINDLNTTKQMGNFYQLLKKHKTINKALRDAKLEFLNNADNISAHPVNWASLNAWGKTDVQLETGFRFVNYLIIISLIIMMVFILKRKLLWSLIKKAVI
jgi:hypothetical protein